MTGKDTGDQDADDGFGDDDDFVWGADIGEDGAIEGWVTSPIFPADPTEPELPIMPPPRVRIVRPLAFAARRAHRRPRNVRLVARMDCTEEEAVAGNGALHFTEFTKQLSVSFFEAIIHSRQYDRNMYDAGGPFDPGVRLLIDFHCTEKETAGDAEDRFHAFHRFLRRDYPGAVILCRRYDRKRPRAL